MNAHVQPVAVAEPRRRCVRDPSRSAIRRGQPLGFNAFDDDRALSGLIAKMAPWAKGTAFRARRPCAGSEAVQDAARLANEHEPKLHDPRPLRQPE